MSSSKVEKIFTPVEHNKVSSEVELKIETLILEGVLRTGEKLPGERELSKSLDVSRPILRTALASLESRGLITIRHGGGAYIANIIGTVFAEPVVELIGKNQKARTDYLEYRREIEGLAAGMAARRATADDKLLLQSIMEEMKAAHEARDAKREAKADVEFHSAIGECTHNVILIHTLRSCYALFSGDVFLNRSMMYSEEALRVFLLEQHEAIYIAIMEGLEEAASQAARKHIEFIESKTREMKQMEVWQETSRKRLALRQV